MENSAPQKFQKEASGFFVSSLPVLALISLTALTATFFISNSSFRFETKTAVFLTIVFAYLLVCALFYLRQKREQNASAFEPQASESVFNSEIERKLLALEEASEFFGASLKPADMFRLVASRADEMIPFAASALFLADDERENFKVVGSSGENAREFLHLSGKISNGLAGKAFRSGKIETDEKLSLEKEALPPEALNNLESAIAVPLKRGGNAVFGVFALYGDEERKFDLNSEKLLAAVGERIAPLFSSAAAFERSVSNALTDSLTSLPNERAFYLILENQIAESQRQRDERPLTVLTVDIKKFAGMNDRYGHATGDKILTFAAETIKAQLRKMDFLARSSNDEFLIVLPTASETTSLEITERLSKAFVLNPYKVEREKVYIELNFGAATFWRDGETAQELLQAANIKRRQKKSGQNNKILWFPKEFVN